MLTSKWAERIRKIKTHAIAFIVGIISAMAMGVWLFYKKLRPPGVKDHGLADRQADRKRRTEEEAEKAAQEDANAAGRGESFQEAESRRDKILTGGLLVLLSLSLLATTAHADEPSPFIPADYDTLKQYYLASWDLSEQYRGLYLQAEDSAKGLRESNTKLLIIIEEQAKEIESLREELRRMNAWSFGALGGVTWSTSGPGVFLGGTVQF